MKLLNKAALYTLGASALALTAMAAPRLDDSLRELNEVVAGILAPYQTVVSKANLEFQTLVTDEANLLKLKVVGAYQRVGKVQTMDVVADQLTFDFAGGKPVTKVSGSAAIDLTRLFQQEQLNNLVESAEGMVLELVKGYTKGYGDAVVLDAKMVEKIQNEAGDYVSFKATVSANMDFSKLPPKKNAEDIAFLAATVNISVVLNKGLVVDADVAYNPAYKGFQGTDAGLNFKAELEKLLSRDAGTMKKIDDVIKKLDGMAANIVDASTR